MKNYLVFILLAVGVLIVAAAGGLALLGRNYATPASTATQTNAATEAQTNTDPNYEPQTLDFSNDTSSTQVVDKLTKDSDSAFNALDNQSQQNYTDLDTEANFGVK